MEDQEKVYYSALSAITALVNSARTAEDVLNSVVEKVATAMDVKGCALLLLTADKKVLNHTADYGLSEKYVRKGPVRADMSITAALDGQPVAVMNATKDDRIQYRKQAKEEGIYSIISVPVQLRTKVIGVMRVYTASPRRFTKPDIDFMCAVANLGAISLERVLGFTIQPGTTRKHSF